MQLYRLIGNLKHFRLIHMWNWPRRVSYVCVFARRILAGNKLDFLAWWTASWCSFRSFTFGNCVNVRLWRSDSICRCLKWDNPFVWYKNETQQSGQFYAILYQLKCKILSIFSLHFINQSRNNEHPRLPVGLFSFLLKNIHNCEQTV